MIKIVTVMDNLEQGMDRKDGGVIKLLKDQKLPATQTEHGLQLQVVPGKVRTVPQEIVDRWVGGGLVQIEDAPAA